jgi:hypothetical protein
MPTPPKYTVDRVFGATIRFQDMFGPEGHASESPTAGGERVWPLIPSQYELPAAQHEETVKECTFDLSGQTGYKVLINGQ